MDKIKYCGHDKYFMFSMKYWRKSFPWEETSFHYFIKTSHGQKKNSAFSVSNNEWFDKRPFKLYKT